MPMDAVFLHGLTQELTQSLTGARIDKVQQPERDLLLLSVRTQGGNAKLLVHGGVGSARVHFTAGTFENPAEPPMFCMLLRKHLVGARITAVSQPDFERMLVLDLDGRDELGTPVKKQLVVEMLGRQSNVILVSGDGHIIDCMRRVDSSMSETRQVQPGLFYRTPLRQDKPVLFDTTPEQRAQVLSAPVTAATVDKWLLGLFSGVSPLLCREVCFRALGDASPRLERLDDAQRARLAHELDALVFTVETNNLSPTMLLDGERPKDFSAVPILQYQGALSCRGCGSFSELLDEFYPPRQGGGHAPPLAGADASGAHCARPHGQKAGHPAVGSAALCRPRGAAAKGRSHQGEPLPHPKGRARRDGAGLLRRGLPGRDD